MNKSGSFVVAGAAVLSLASAAFGQTSTGTPADNSKTNKADAHMSASADAQKNDATDLSLTRRIRQSVMADKSLSTYAHNVKIVAVNGTVTLNGPVRSDAEKTSVESKAAAVAGKDHIVNQITVAPPKS